MGQLYVSLSHNAISLLNGAFMHQTYVVSEYNLMELHCCFST